MPPRKKRAARENRLAEETSPYLKQHAGNPVEWYPWGEDALARSREEKKPIFLSVGYSACHWCHVMAHESFEDAEIAELLNKYFINIKVDREERPDIDQLYQGVVVLMDRGGGWPLSVFLTPELRPFFAGTYFPKEDRYGMPGFKKLLEALHDAWDSKREEVEQQAKQFEQGLVHLSTYGLEAPKSVLGVRDVIGAAQRLERSVDRNHGGFGGAPKFPNPMNVAFLLRGYRRNGAVSMRSSALFTLEKMAKGGIYDQLGGGFHRYSVDDKWLVPHFEKMLYDNAQLLHLYSEAFQLEPRPLWKKVVEETAGYIQREMTAPSGGFYSAQDADSDGEEGKFFVWTPEALDQLLSPEEAAVVKAHFGVSAPGNFEQGRSVLEVKADIEGHQEETLARARKKLFEAREKRVKPGLDDKILAGWNGLMIRGLALASRVFARREWAELAKGAADFVLATLWTGEKLLRCHAGGISKIDGLLEDYGDFAAGLIALFQATSDAKYLEAAKAVADAAVLHFWDEQRQAYFTAPKGQKDLLCRSYALHDNAYPSGASTLTEAHVMLAALTAEKAFLEQAERYLSRLVDDMAKNPFAYGHLWLSADSFLEGAGEVILVGEASAIEPLWAAVNATYAPTLAAIALPTSSPVPALLKETLQGKEPFEGRATAYVCRNFACEPPVTDADELKSRLERLAAATVVSF